MIGWTESSKVGNEVCVEVDLRSSKKEERRIRFIVNGKIQNCVIVGLGNEIRYGVWNNNPIIFLYLYFYYLSLIIILFYYSYMFINSD